MKTYSLHWELCVLYVGVTLAAVFWLGPLNVVQQVGRLLVIVGGLWGVLDHWHLFDVSFQASELGPKKLDSLIPAVKRRHIGVPKKHD